MLTTSESDEEEDYSRDDGADEEDGDDHEDFDSDEEEGFWEEDDINDEVESTEEENSDYDGDTGEDDTDQDEFSYEGLILLGEILGMNRGLPADEVTKFLRPCEYKIECKNGLDRCVICQVDYEEGESLVSLPCEHPYHSDCISNWLQIKKVCPICSTDVSSPPLVKD
ncbi:PREDICTED: E3 ubiquitin ligase BIG BROTHER-related-like [Nelumbo nucifera]|nr:PREDICTED: E3 ubiquitin ligase BIG BROTHER-related-like [Nelumbo nucifera]